MRDLQEIYSASKEVKNTYIELMVCLSFARSSEIKERLKGHGSC